MDYSNSASSSITKSGSNENQWYEWDIKNLVQDWITDTENDHGLMVKFRDDDVAQSSHRWFRFFSSDNSESAYRPKLIIKYSVDVLTTYYIRDASGNVIATYKK